MATYVIGDIQGCYRSLQGLLDRFGFDPAADRLWLVGDLVNRGPESLAVLRWARDQGDRLTMVLGNHDLHLIAVADGIVVPRGRDTMSDILAASDGPELVEWLRQRPLAHREGDHLLVHAGLLPPWSWDDALDVAAAVGAALRDDRAAALLERTRADDLGPWGAGCHPEDHLQLGMAALTRVRCLRLDGTMHEKFKRPPEEAPPEIVPWFDHPGRQPYPGTVVCGHWAALGLLLVPDVIALDTGCVWGNALSAVRLDDGAVFQQPCIDAVMPS